MRVTYIGHATLLIEIGETKVLTDPNFDPKLGRILPRVSPPGIAPHALPRIDALLLTHAHADHLSFDSLDLIGGDAPLYAPPVVASWLRRSGYGYAQDLPPGDQVVIGSITVHAAAAKHRGNRYGFDRWRAAASMYLMESSRESCFFAGDTALTPETHALVERVLWRAERRLDLALLPIGYAPWWKPGFRRGHLTPGDALSLFERLRARALVPYHWGTFRHVTAGAHDAIERFKKEAAAHHLADLVRIIEPGESLLLDPVR